MRIENELAQIKADIEYCKKLLEDLTMTTRSGADNREMLTSQMANLKQMFCSIPGLSPEVRQNLNNIFDQAGAKS